MSDITFVGSVTGIAANGGDITFDLSAASPSGPSAGDIVIIVSGCRDRAGTEGRIGNALSYTEIVDVVDTQRCRIAYKVFATGETGPVVEGSANAADATSAVANIFRGQSGSPFDVTTTTASGSGAPDAPAITPISDNCMIVAVATNKSNDAGIGTPAFYTASGYVTQNDTNPSSTAAAYRLLSGGGGSPEDPDPFTSWISGNWAAATMALRPSTGGAAHRMFAVF